ncbi:hypothetical protein MC7420_6683 [Coleofasciculus chthonoplastes PCC 7420]|uniref:Collagen triple helix repeat protein n=1 Tax=Coleofasciculus chthonoplastes PCC 7420 TaxID=118168 RepID=B4VWE8_9CYAN|nr:hypothetical protein MC7420_6683 [Coleofasciculus chthonoplastes PCC 7420]
MGELGEQGEQGELGKLGKQGEQGKQGKQRVIRCRDVAGYVWNSEGGFCRNVTINSYNKIPKPAPTHSRAMPSNAVKVKIRIPERNCPEIGQNAQNYKRTC